MDYHQHAVHIARMVEMSDPIADTVSFAKLGGQFGIPSFAMHSIARHLHLLERTAYQGRTTSHHPTDRALELHRVTPDGLLTRAGTEHLIAELLKEPPKALRRSVRLLMAVARVLEEGGHHLHPDHTIG